MLQDKGIFSATAAGISVAATSSALTAVAIPGVGSVIRVTNEGPNVVFIAIGNASVLATLPTGTGANTCTPVMNGVTVTLSVPVPPPGGQNYISTICRATQTAVLTVQSGEGHQ